MVKIYSHSRIKTFEQCPLKYKYKYIEKIIPEIEKTIEAVLGKAIHSTLEWIYIKAKNKAPSIDEIISVYSEEWNKEYTPNTLLVKENLTPDDYFNKGVKFLVDYYVDHKPFDDNTLDVEKRIDLILDDQGEYRIVGFIDRLVYNLEQGCYEIHDYKTANTLPTQEDMDNDRQLALYSIAIKEEHGEDKEIKLIWHYLAHTTRIESKRTNQQLQELKKETLEKIKKIESSVYFPPLKSTLCNWCEYKSICPAWGNSPKETQKRIETYEETEEKDIEKK